MKVLLAVVIVFALCFTIAPAWAGMVYVKADSPGPAFDGMSWNTAFHKVQDGINAAAAGDEIWVAAGNYVGNIALTKQIALYGGFAGNETSRSQRNWRANVTVLDANGIGNVISVSPGLSTSTVIDGFKITKSAECGSMLEVNGIYCNASSPTISNNIISNNGYGIYVSSGSPYISSNEIRSNFRIGIYCPSASPVVVSNYVAANTGGGIYISGTGWKLINNTIVGNVDSLGNGTGVSVGGSHGIVANNIIAFNVKGLYTPPSGVDVANNCVCGNTSRDYEYITDQTGINGNIKADPKFASYMRDLHIQPDSPCRNAGSNARVQADWKDIDGQSRILPVGGTVDIGADESDGTIYNYVSKPVFSLPGGTYYTPQTVTITCSTPGAVIHYTTNGVDPAQTDPVIISGSSLTINIAITLKASAWKTGWLTGEPASANYKITGTVAAPTFSVRSGSYQSHKIVTIQCDTPGSTIRYTTNGTEPTVDSKTYTAPVLVDISLTLKAKAWKTDWMNSATASAAYALRAPSTIRAKKDAPGPVHDGTSWETAFASAAEALDYTVRGDEVWVSNGVYIGCVNLPPGVKLYGGFAGSETEQSQRNWKANETILDGNKQGSTVTILYGVNEGTTIDGFTIRNGSADFGGGISVRCGALATDYLAATISNNKITGNTASLGAGIACEWCGPVITANEITDNTASSGGGIYSLNASPQVSQNRIARNTASSGGGIALSDRCSAAITNNEIIENASLVNGGGLCMPKTNWTSGLPNIYGNVFEANTAHSDGGAIALYDQASIMRNRIVNNKSLSGNGGGLYLDGGMSYTIYINLIAANSARNGGGIYCGRYNLKIVSCTIADNSATLDGGGVYYGSSGASIFSSIVCNNSSGIFVTGSGSDTAVKASCIFHNISYDVSGFTTNPLNTNGNFSADPMFANPLCTDYHLNVGSPCIDTAQDTFGVDLDGNSAPKDGNRDGISKPDIGCYEAPANYTTIKTAKALANGSPIGITDTIVTAIMPGRFYVETPDKVSGIGVLGSVLSAGKRATIEGTMTTVDGERLITPTSTKDNGSAAIPAPWFMNANAIGGSSLGLQAGVSDWRKVRKVDPQNKPFFVRDIFADGGLNNIGLLIKTTGRVTYFNDECFYIDSSAIFDDGSESVKGIKVLRLPAISYNPQLGDFLVVTGISSCFEMDNPAGRYARLIRPVSVELMTTAH